MHALSHLLAFPWILLDFGGLPAALLAALFSVAFIRGEWSHRRPPRGRPHRIYWCLLAGLALVWSWFYWMPISTLRPVWALLLSITAAVLWGRNHRAWALGLWIPVSLLSLPAVPSPAIPAVWIFLSLIIGGLFIRHFPQPWHAVRMGTLSFCSLSLASGFAFKVPPRLDLAAEIVRQPEVDYAGGVETSGTLARRNARWMTEACGGHFLLAGAKGGPLANGALWIGPPGKEPLREVEPGSIAGWERGGWPPHLRLTDTVLHDCGRNRLVLLNEFPAALVFLQGDYPPALAAVPFGRGSSARHAWLTPDGDIWVRLGTPGQTLLHLQADGTELERFVSSGANTCVADVSTHGHPRSLFLSDPQALLLEREFHFNSVDPPRLKEHNTSTCALLPSMNAMVVPGFIFAGVWWVHVRDGTVERLDLGRGIRTVHALPDGNSFLAVNYFSGDVSWVDGRTRDPLRRLHVGPRARRINFSADGRRAYVVSSAGAFVIDVSALTAGRGRPVPEASRSGRDGRLILRNADRQD